MLLLSQISVHDIRQGELFEQVPELARLQRTSEWNGWHYGESTFERTLNVLKNTTMLLKLPQLAWLAADLRSKTIDHLSLLELFLWANLLHDIAKPDTQKVFPDGTTLYPDHEMIGAGVAKEIMNRLGFTERQVAWVYEIVYYHGEMHKFFGRDDDSFNGCLAEWQLDHGEFFHYLLLHSWADTLGSREQEISESTYLLRLHRYEQILRVAPTCQMK